LICGVKGLHRYCAPADVATALLTGMLDKTDGVQGNLKCWGGSHKHTAASRLSVTIPWEIERTQEWRLQIK